MAENFDKTIQEGSTDTRASNQLNLLDVTRGDTAAANAPTTEGDYRQIKKEKSLLEPQGQSNANSDEKMRWIKKEKAMLGGGERSRDVQGHDNSIEMTNPY